MARKLLFCAFFIFLSACGGTDLNTPVGENPFIERATPAPVLLPEASPVVEQATGPTETVTEPTPDIAEIMQATSNAAQATHDAAQRDIEINRAIQIALTATMVRDAINSQETLTAHQDIGATAQANDKHTQTAHDDAMNATENALIVMGATMTFEAPGLALTQARAANEQKYGWMNSAGILLVSICVVVLIGGMAWVLFSRRPDQEPAQPEREYPPVNHWNQVRPLGQGKALVPRVIPAGVSERSMILFAQKVATSTYAAGIPFVRAAWVGTNGMPRPEWQALIFFLTDEKNNYARKINPDVDASPYTFTPAGERFLSGFANDPLPQGDGLSRSAALSSESPAGQAGIAGGEGVV